jgi:4-amino-4-deoxy-L-arabinose transferase-like glycosyltransferase
MKNYNKLFKLVMWVLVVISVVLLVWGFLTGFEANDGRAVNVLLYWAYAILGLAILAVVVFGLIISAKNDPKSLVRLGVGLLVIAAVCFIAYLIAPGKMPLQWTNAKLPTASELKLTDTILNLTYFTGALSIIAIIFGEIMMAIRNKK